MEEKGKFDFSNEDIKSLRSLIEDKEIIEEDDLEDLRKESKIILHDSVTLAKVFLKFYGYLYMNKNLFKVEDKDYIQKLEWYLSGFRIEELRRQVEDYGKDGSDFGSYYIAQKIKYLVDKNREKMIDLISMSSKIFLEEE